MKALVTAELDFKLLPELEELCEINIAGWGKENRKLKEEELIQLLRDKEILITSYDEVTRRVIEACPELKLIACTRANPVNIDVNAARERNIVVVYTPGRNSDCTAEFTIALMLNIARKIPIAYRSLKEGKYLAEGRVENRTKEGLKEDVTWALGTDSPYVVFKGHQLKNKTLGLIGYGSIGRRVANLARAFGMRILIYDPYVPEVEVNDLLQRKVELETLLKESDFVSCHCKVTEATRGLMGRREFKLMKRTAFFINTSRGAIVDEDALIEALRNGEIAGAALDVFATEPLPKDHPFITELDNVIITPHLGGATYDVLTIHTRMVINELRRYFSGQVLLHQFN